MRSKLLRSKPGDARGEDAVRYGIERTESDRERELRREIVSLYILLSVSIGMLLAYVVIGS